MADADREIGDAARNPNSFEEFDSLNDLIVHLKNHINFGTEIMCPFNNCAQIYSNKSSFSSHMSRKHTRPWGLDAGRSDLMTSVNCFDAKVFETDLALLYLRLQSKLLVPASTIQIIVEELANLFDIEKKFIKAYLLEKFKNHGLDDNVSERIVEELERDNVLYDIVDKDKGIFRSIYSRNKYYKDRMNYVAPEKILIGNYGDIQHYMYYVPIQKVISGLVNDSTFASQIMNAIPVNESILDDIHGSSIYRELKIQMENDRFLELIFYQDEFEIVNPLGSAKKTHKILACYYTFGNIYPWHRSKIDQIQLAFVCKSDSVKKFGIQCVFKKISATYS
ncbi:uncharacterized protein LOC141902120 [Tubulanus polymorphus]|uniref:uncharacterized protein LOC141902120 n=1 Tax=Tubulanus polymorphus TaxID=672921 RepID=UPI003DA341ED